MTNQVNVRYARVKALKDATAMTPVQVKAPARNVRVEPGKFTANALQVPQRSARVIHSTGGIAAALSDRLRYIIEQEGLGGDVYPKTTGSATEYFLQTEGAPIINLSDGLTVWVRPHTSNDAGPVTIQVDGTDTKELQLLTGGTFKTLTADTLRTNTPTPITYNSFQDVWAIGATLAELTPEDRSAFDELIEWREIAAEPRTDSQGRTVAGVLLEAEAGPATGQLTVTAFRDAQTGAASSEVNINSDVFRFNGNLAAFGGTLQSDGYSTGTGWRLDQNGNAEFLGGLSVFGGAIQSDNYDSNNGWQIDANGNATFNTLNLRPEIIDTPDVKEEATGATRGFKWDHGDFEPVVRDPLAYTANATLEYPLSAEYIFSYFVDWVGELQSSSLMEVQFLYLTGSSSNPTPNFLFRKEILGNKIPAFWSGTFRAQVPAGSYDTVIQTRMVNILDTSYSGYPSDTHGVTKVEVDVQGVFR